MPVCVVFGDSNSHGTPPLASLGDSARFAHEDRWPNVMAQALGPGWEVISEALPGRTTVHDDPVEGGARSGIAVLPAILHSHKPIDLMILMLGTNDLKQRFGVRASEIASSTGRLLREIDASGVVHATLVIAPVPVREIGTLEDVFAGAEARQDGLERWLEDMAHDHGAGFLCAGDFADVSDIDGVHLDVEGHHALGIAVADAVQNLMG